jgi:hypothetical protein
VRPKLLLRGSSPQTEVYYGGIILLEMKLMCLSIKITSTESIWFRQAASYFTSYFTTVFLGFTGLGTREATVIGGQVYELGLGNLNTLSTTILNSLAFS